mmetsp:Transcript_36927/g.105018  ORF Transcript_36927/g.105018 Transcript_36927/m.105018 type:complete len:248 (-) Transcript_36927:56-799(-)
MQLPRQRDDAPHVGGVSMSAEVRHGHERPLPPPLGRLGDLRVPEAAAGARPSPGPLGAELLPQPLHLLLGPLQLAPGDLRLPGQPRRGRPHERLALAVAGGARELRAVGQRLLLGHGAAPRAAGVRGAPLLPRNGGAAGEGDDGGGEEAEEHRPAHLLAARRRVVESYHHLRLPARRATPLLAGGVGIAQVRLRGRRRHGAEHRQADLIEDLPRQLPGAGRGPRPGPRAVMPRVDGPRRDVATMRRR